MSLNPKEQGIGRLLALGHKQGGLGRCKIALVLSRSAIILLSRPNLASKLRGLPSQGAQGVAIVEGWEKYSLGAILSQPVVGGSFMR